MKHPHAELIKQWLDDTSREFYSMGSKRGIETVLNDVAGILKFKFIDIDPYASLRKAQEEGKRVVLNLGGNHWVDQQKMEKKWDFNAPVELYKIAEPDKYAEQTWYSPFGRCRIKFKKCGITGKVTAEVVDDESQ